MSEAPLVYISVLNYRNYSDTIECVRALEQIDYANHRVVIVDNGSDNESEQVLRETFPHHVVLQTGRNGGYAAGNNAGIRRALDDGAEFVLILNNDTLPERRFLSELVAHALAHPEVGLLGSLIVLPGGEPDRISARRRPPLREIFWNRGPGRWFGLHRGWRRHAYYEDEYGLDGPTEVEVVSGSCMLLRAGLLEEIGLLDERTFLFWEEFILSEKIRKTRFGTVLVPRSRVVHKGGGSVGTVGWRASSCYLSSLNHYLAHYRDVGLLARYATLAGPAIYFLPGLLKTLTGWRSAEARLRSKSSANR